jgi:hypothetical protein
VALSWDIALGDIQPVLEEYGLQWDPAGASAVDRRELASN